ncbi:MAG: glycosyltransferase [Synergistetes bacterium]|nr:glycosyltransferase [Synergistota bacterium]MDW8192721.1 glycosyltransferase [Synergistota bacterium]
MTKLILIPHLGRGGAERVAVNLFKALGFDGFITFENLIDYPMPEEKVFCINSPASQSLFKKFLNLPFRIYRIRKIKKKLKPNLTISLLEPANLYNLLTKFPEERIFVSFRSNYTLDILNSPFWGQGLTKKVVVALYKLAFKLIYNKADVLVAASESVKWDMVKNYNIDPYKIKVIYNPIYFDEISLGVREDLGEHCGIFSYPVLITVGRLTKAKGQWYLLRIFKALKCDFPDLKLVILGDGELKGYLVKLSEELNLRTYLWDRDELSSGFDVYFLGFHRNPFKFVSNSALFLFPSLWEGLPNVLVEALACGVPVISSDCRSGPREVLAPDTDFEYQTEVPEFADYGVLMPVFDGSFKGASEPLDDKERMWVDVVKKLLLDEGLRKGYSQKGKERAKDFDIKVIAKKWQEILGDYL